MGIPWKKIGIGAGIAVGGVVAGGVALKAIQAVGSLHHPDAPAGTAISGHAGPQASPSPAPALSAHMDGGVAPARRRAPRRRYSYAPRRRRYYAPRHRVHHRKHKNRMPPALRKYWATHRRGK